MARRLKGSAGKGRKPSSSAGSPRQDWSPREAGAGKGRDGRREADRGRTQDGTAARPAEGSPALPSRVTASGEAARSGGARRQGGPARAGSGKKPAGPAKEQAQRGSYGRKTTGSGGGSATGGSKSRVSSTTQRPEPGSAPGSVPVARAAVSAVGLVRAGSGEYRSGFACFVGRPNAGKSTLTNALVGEKVAITSNRPQTTRRAIRGIVHRPDAQIVLVDTPGLHRPRTLLGQRLNDLVRETLTEVDVIGFCLPADQKIGPGDTFIAAELQALAASRRKKVPVIALATKADAVDRARLAEHLLAIEELLPDAEIVPVSAVDGFQVDVVADLIVANLPEGPPLYPDGELTDEPEQVMIAELVREAALEGVHDELPHSLAVVVEEITARPEREGLDPLLDVHVWLYVERESQKGIVIGRGGARLRDVGIAARRQIEALLGQRVHLDLRVKVAKDWQRDPKQLQRLGF
ncbi:MAG: GTPase Era [Kineosporiaceae bacterium]